MSRIIRKNSKALFLSRSRWSRENTVIRVTAPNTRFQTFGTNIVPATSTQGMRTVGNFVVTLSSRGTTEINLEPQAIYWALVYVPQGQTTAALNISDSGSLYEPNQYVIACGMNSNTAGPIRIRTKALRKLNSGDFVSLLMATSETDLDYSGVVSYSVKYN